MCDYFLYGFVIKVPRLLVGEFGGIFFYQNSKLYLESYFSQVNVIWLDMKHNSAVGGVSEGKRLCGGGAHPLTEGLWLPGVRGGGGE